MEAVRYAKLRSKKETRLIISAKTIALFQVCCNDKCNGWLLICLISAPALQQRCYASEYVSPEVLKGSQGQGDSKKKSSMCVSCGPWYSFAFLGLFCNSSSQFHFVCPFVCITSLCGTCVQCPFFELHKLPSP